MHVFLIEHNGLFCFVLPHTVDMCFCVADMVFSRLFRALFVVDKAMSSPNRSVVANPWSPWAMSGVMPAAISIETRQIFQG